MRNFFPLIFLFTLILSCSQKNQFPDYLTQKVSNEMLTVKTFDTIQVKPEEKDSVKNPELPGCLEQLSASVEEFSIKNQVFSIENMSSHWEECKNVLTGLNLSQVAQEKWIDATGLLFQLTTNAKYAEQLQQIFLTASNPEIKQKAASFVITKNVDHLHVNLFIPAEFEYEHSLGGNIKMVMETNFPESGKVKLEFSTEQKRYIELFIRIPLWAKDAHVTAKGVKYIAHPGEYSKIAKKWQTGDSVRIEFSIEQKPVFPN